MAEDVRSTYDAKSLLAGLPSDRGELFIGYTASIESDEWRERFRQSLSERPGRIIWRSIWGRADQPDLGVVIDVVECASAADAIDELMERLAENQLAKLERGPDELGPAAFAHPNEAPPALFFARANLVISIVSQGRDDGLVDTWLKSILGDLDLEPRDARPGIEIEPGDKVDTGGRFLRYRLPWKLGPTGWFKFVSEGATLERGKDPGELLLGPSKQPITLRGWALEQGREPHEGRFENNR